MTVPVQVYQFRRREAVQPIAITSGKGTTFFFALAHVKPFIIPPNQSYRKTVVFGR